ncbi:MAG: prolyl oligopeptidase family serine peptidase [Planctomycetota bacterium]|nr:prolyl oligopeptidase family serine peptidase [Planctomycetota bacterium]
MSPLLGKLPDELASRVRTVRLGGSDNLADRVPALLAHPNWQRPAPTVIWMHGRTANKELDPGRYLRWIRLGIAACAIDLPGHGERAKPELARLQTTEGILDLIHAALSDVDHVVEALADPSFAGVFDLDRLGIGGMSAGGMVTLRKLCERHDFRCASVEATTGDLRAMYERASDSLGFDAARLRGLDPASRLASWKPLPLLVSHSEADRIVPFEHQRAFVESLRNHYRARGVPDSLIELRTWPETGAPDEHIGFGRFSNDAKNAQADFFKRHLLP